MLEGDRMAQRCASSLAYLQGALIEVLALVIRHVREQLRPLLCDLSRRSLRSVCSEVFLRRFFAEAPLLISSIDCKSCTLIQAAPSSGPASSRPLFLLWILAAVPGVALPCPMVPARR